MNSKSTKPKKVTEEVTRLVMASETYKAAVAQYNIYRDNIPKTLYNLLREISAIRVLLESQYADKS